MARMVITSPPMTEKQKAWLRRSKGIKAPFSVDKPVTLATPKEREYYAPVLANFVPKKPRGRSGCRMSHEKRLVILAKLEARAAFFRDLGVSV